MLYFCPIKNKLETQEHLFEFSNKSAIVHILILSKLVNNMYVKFNTIFAENTDISFS